MLYMAFQATFCIITAALISGAIVERMRFSAYLLFISLWSVVVYAPMAHWVWGGGWLADMGAWDFAGGTVVHVNAGAAALVAAMVVGKRSDYGHASILPHNIPTVLLGAGLLWFGWFGFNAGSAVAASPIAGLAFVTTMLAPAATLVVWTFLDMMRSGKPTAVGMRDRDRRRPGGHHAGGRLHQPDERDRPGRDCRGPELPGVDHSCQDLARRFTRRCRGARRRREPWARF
jgi:Amt family ammonium transporter